MMQLLKDLILNIVRVFIDNIRIKNLNIYYNEEKMHKRICQYILKIIQNLNKILMNIKCTEKSILKEKLQFIMKYIKIVNYVYKSESRSLVVNKILKILN